MSTKKQLHQSAGSLLAHHAYLGVSTSISRDAVLQLLEEHFQIVLKSNSNAHVFCFQQCGVEDVRDVVERACLKPTRGDGYVVLIADSITREAQNAFLKILEEPPVHMYLFLFFPPHQFILPTIRSRVVPIPFVVVEKDMSEAEDFLSAPIPKRIQIISEMIEADDKQKLHALLTQIEAIFSTRLDTALPEDIFTITKKLALIQETRKDLSMTGAMQKMLLESVALLV